ncbi:MAG: Ig-like domain-containing protein [Luteolibacter sp.]
MKLPRPIKLAGATFVGVISLMLIASLGAFLKSHHVGVAQDSADSHNDWGFGQVGQSFTIQEDQTIVGAQVLTQVRGKGAQRIRLNLQSCGDADVPGQEILATGISTLFPTAPDFAWRTVYFTTPYQARAGERICLVPGNVTKVTPHAWHEYGYSSADHYQHGILWFAGRNKRADYRDQNADLAFSILTRPTKPGDLWNAIFSPKLENSPLVEASPPPEFPAPPSQLSQSIDGTAGTQKAGENAPLQVLYTRPVMGETASSHRLLFVGLDRPLDHGVPLPVIQVKDEKSGVVIPGEVRLLSDRRLLAFIPEAPFSPKRIIVVDLSNPPSAENQYTPHSTWFRTYDGVSSPPEIISTIPGYGYGNVSPAISIVTRWSEPLLNESLVGAFVLQDEDGNEIPSTLQYEPFWYQVEITPKRPLERAREYRLRVNEQVTNLRGATMDQDFMMRFETLPLELIPTAGVPHVVETLPKNHAGSVPRDFMIQLTWSEPMAEETMLTNQIQLSNPRSKKELPTTVSYDPDSRVLSVRPTALLDFDTWHTLKIDDSVKSKTGVGFGWAESWHLTFKTISETPADGDILQFGYPGPGGPLKPR